MKNLLKPLLMAATLATPLAHAHVTLEEPAAIAGKGYKATLRVGHGCEGTATHTLRISVPAGFRGAKPTPKPGWAITLRRAPLAQPYESHGRRVTEGVVEVTWRATTREAWLEDAHYDEFVLRGQAPAQPGPLWFKVVQGCVVGRNEWTQVPDSGTATKGLKSPAALLNVEATPAPAPAPATPHQH